LYHILARFRRSNAFKTRYRMFLQRLNTGK